MPWQPRDISNSSLSSPASFWAAGSRTLATRPGSVSGSVWLRKMGMLTAGRSAVEAAAAAAAVAAVVMAVAAVPAAAGGADGQEGA